jgi:anhydro-N-acetylmuramic acid kinase
MKKKVFTAIGLMSGTSMDGVDLSIIKSDGNNEFIGILDNYHEFNHNLQQNLISFREKIKSSEDLTKYSNEFKILEREITLFHNNIINEAIKNYNEEIDLIGFHGQTIFHNSEEKLSVQLGDGKLLSQLTKKIVINNFRENDLMNGGQGAPLAPIFHKLISNRIAQKEKSNNPINFINIGGITNLTHTTKTNLYAYDIGPGNCLIDEWVRKNSKKKFDVNGDIASAGKVDDLILNQAIDNFSIKSFDKSLDIKDFDLSFARGLTLEDGCATLTNFSAYLISKGIEHLIEKTKIHKGIYLVCGGGRKNNQLIKNINEYLFDKKIELKNIDNYGFNGDNIESQTFAYLAIRSYLGLPLSFPETTRCNDPTLGGTLNKNY